LVSQRKREAEQEKNSKTVFSKSNTYPEINGFTFTDYVSGKKKMELRAERASIKPKKIGFFKTPLVREAYMVKPEIYFFADGTEVTRVTAASATMDMGDRKILLKENVELTTADGKKITASKMALDVQHGLLSVPGAFTMDNKGVITRGRGLKSDIEFRRVLIKSEQITP